jgi:hypothetical protein
VTEGSSKFRPGRRHASAELLCRLAWPHIYLIDEGSDSSIEWVLPKPVAALAFWQGRRCPHSRCLRQPVVFTHLTSGFRQPCPEYAIYWGSPGGSPPLVAPHTTYDGDMAHTRDRRDLVIGQQCQQVG